VSNFQSRSREAENERENLRSLFRFTPEMVCILRGPEHIFEFVNESHVRTLGFDATGMKVREAQPDSVEVHGILDNVYQTGQTAELHEIPVTVSGRLRYFNLTYSARRDVAGQINGVMILGVEITDQILARQNLEQTQRRMQLALDAARMGAFEIDLKAEEFLASPQTEEIFGHENMSGDLQAAVKRSVHPEDLERTMANTFQAITDKTHYSDEFRVIRSDGRLAWILSQGEAVYDSSGQPTRFYGVVQDITKRKADEEKLAQALQGRDEFLSIASHELKTPVTSLKLQLQMGLRGDLDADKIRKIFQTANRQVDRLTALVEDLLDVSRIRSGKLGLDLAPFCLPQLVQEVIERFEQQFRLAGMEVSYACSAPATTINGDQFRLDQVITNIFTNAIKYAPHNGLEVKLYTEDSCACIEVRDYGEGVANEQQELIFDRFERAGIQNNLGGLGLGLYISRMIVNAHGGHIGVISQPGEGATFKVKLPLA
jgi:PAS domain S-box-containing protein